MSRVAGELVITAPKSDRSRRTVPLSDPMVTMLKKHATAQKEVPCLRISGSFSSAPHPPRHS
jgi:hypothetical protein